MDGRQVTLQVTLRQVAQDAEVHPSTVSRALNDATSGLVAPDTRERIRRSAEQLGYRPNAVARSLRANHTHTVAMVLPDITNPCCPLVVRGVADELERLAAATRARGLEGHDYTMLLASTDDDPNKEAAVLESMLARQVDGLVLASSGGDATTIAQLCGSERPFVLVDRMVAGLDVPAVTSDDRKGGRLVAAHLVAHGHRRIAELSGPRWLLTGAMRHEGLVEGLARAGAPLDPFLSVETTTLCVQAGWEATRELLRRGPAPTAVVCGDDLLALGCMDVLAEHGLRVPEDISVTGYNDMPRVDRLAVPLTTIRVSHHQMGVTAGRLLAHLLAGNPPPWPALRLLDVELVVRASAGPPCASSR
jgi:LacI family transcriptional regulator, galactose operon repressor